MPLATASAPTVVLDADAWRAREQAHADRADTLTARHRARAARGERHPIEDFLFTYYSYSPSLLRRWHPGAGVELADAATTPRAEWRWYAQGSTPDGLIVDRGAMEREKPAMLGLIRRILGNTAARPGSFGCFGLHEWAMVYRQGEHRHAVPLRLGQAATDETPDGKAEYVRRQRAFAERSNVLRDCILEAWTGESAPAPAAQ